MAHAQAAVPASPVLSGFFSRLRSSFARSALRRLTIRELNSLSDRELQDIGMHRSDIIRVAEDAARRA